MRKYNKNISIELAKRIADIGYNVKMHIASEPIFRKEEVDVEFEPFPEEYPGFTMYKHQKQDVFNGYGEPIMHIETNQSDVQIWMWETFGVDVLVGKVPGEAAKNNPAYTITISVNDIKKYKKYISDSVEKIKGDCIVLKDRWYRPDEALDNGLQIAADIISVISENN